MDIGMIKRIGSRKALIIVAFANWLVKLVRLALKEETSSA
jgi:hypothetical protein